ncbi:hypothetical protein [Stappia sp.]|uniref:hypothetical protein n=1 Tax=Stappia sp. TaxID=1870903 RepID=UPI003A99B550
MTEVQNKSYLDRIVFAAIGAGIAAIAAGAFYVIDFQKRVSILETQFTLTSVSVSGATQIERTSSHPETSSAGSVPEHAIQSDDSQALQQIATACAEMMTSYKKIVDAGSLYSSENERLAALTNQMSRIGCEKLISR